MSVDEPEYFPRGARCCGEALDFEPGVIRLRGRLPAQVERLSIKGSLEPGQLDGERDELTTGAVILIGRKVRAKDGKGPG